MSVNWKAIKWKKPEWKKLLRRDNMMVLILAGALLFVISLPADGEGGTGETPKLFAGSGVQGSKAEGTGDTPGLYAGSAGDSSPLLAGLGAQGVLASADPAADYAQTLEKRLTEALSEIEGMGQVRVMITLKSSQELVVERETQESRSVTAETDARGGSRTVETGQTQGSVVYSTEGGASSPYVVKAYVPEIEGVLVLAQGAGSGKVNRTVTEIVRALFAVEAHKIKVVKMETKTR